MLITFIEASPSKSHKADLASVLSFSLSKCNVSSSSLSVSHGVMAKPWD